MKQISSKKWMVVLHHGGWPRWNVHPDESAQGKSQNKRLSGRGGNKASDFPSIPVVKEPFNRNAHQNSEAIDFPGVGLILYAGEDTSFSGGYQWSALGVASQ